MENKDEMLQAIFDQAAVGIAQIGLDGSYLRVNNRYCQMLGYSESELRTKRICDLTHPDDVHEVLAARSQLLEGAISSHTMEKRYIRKDGTAFWGRLNRALVRDDANLPKFFVAVVEDITEKIKAERALRDRERQLLLAQNAGHLGLWDRDLRTGATVTSEEFARLLGLTPDRLPPDHEGYLQLVHPADRQRVQAEYQQSVELTHVWNTEFRVIWPDASTHWLLAKGQVFLDDAGRPVRLAGVNLDITERKHAEAELRESEQHLKNAERLAHVGHFQWDLRSNTVSGSEEMFKIFGQPQSYTPSTEDFMRMLVPRDRERVASTIRDAIEKKMERCLEYQIITPNGDLRTIACTLEASLDEGGLPARIFGACQDITDSRRAQEEAAARQKLESLGALAGGFAHDFNNLLGGILAQAELVEADLAAGLPPHEEIARIKTVAIRGAEIVRELMIYAGRDQASIFESVDLSRLAAEMLELMKVSISKHAALKINLDKDLPAVLGNAPQIRQVLMNLVINASEAIGEKEEGVIRVTTSRVAAGDYVQLEVSDSGCGLTGEAKAKIFDPFYTTKFAGRGLGLAVVQGIVRAHGGTIDVVSAPGQGATFQVLLPCTSNRALKTQNAAIPSTAEGPHALNLTGATVLVVEDEEVLRRAVSKALRIKGFSVMEAQDGSVAMDLVRTRGDHIDVILLDVTLPGTSSKEVFEAAQRMRASIKVVLTSAYDRKTVDAFFPGLRITQFIRKPFQLDELVGTLRDALSVEPAHQKP